MIVKALVAASLAAAPVAVSSDVAFVQYPQVQQVRCDEGRGTAVYTSKGWVSVAHVTSMTNCRINQWPVIVSEQNGELDFSRLVIVAPRLAEVRISCEGFKAGEYYWATGHAFGKPYQTNVRIRATGLKGWRTFDALVGGYTVVPGMSGGMVMNSRGEMVGMVNAYNPVFGLSFSRSLKETSLCR